MEFKEYVLEEVLEKIFSGGTPNTQRKEYWDGGIPWLSSGETRNRIIKYTERSITIEGANNSSTKQALRGDIVIASAGQGFTRGQTSLLYIDTYVNQSIIALRANNEIIDNKYLYYNISSRYNELRAISDSASIRGSLTTAILKKLKVQLPPLEIQRKIVSILWGLDSKIELNNEIIRNIEDVISTLFKKWFIDFEFPNEQGLPYRSSGGEMVESELGEIPKDFEIKELSSICEVKDGTHDSPKQVTEGFPLVTSKHLTDNSIDFSSAKLISKEDYEKVNKRSQVNTNDILISMIGTVGKLYLVQDKGINFAIKNIGLIKTSQIDYYEYIFGYFKSNFMKSYIKERTTGSTQQYISLTELRKIPLLVPGGRILEEYKKIVKPIYEMIATITVENQRLVSLRDSLLPKLLSGEIEIPDESVVEP